MCGIVGVYDIENCGNQDLPEIAFDLLRGNKNRGQEGYGISVTLDNGKIDTYKFQDIYNRDVIEAIKGSQGKILGVIGHARYPTSGGRGTGDDYTQPFSVDHLEDGFAFAFNGNIANAEDIAQEMEKDSNMNFPRPILDTKILQEMILREMRGGEIDSKRILENINNSIDGACNIVLASRDGSFTLAKDRWGFRPFSFAQRDGLFLFSSESDALFKVGCDDTEIKFVNTGEAVKYNSKSGKIIQASMDLSVPTNKKRCFFETVYFANPKTKLWKEPSSNHRYRLGQNLAKRDKTTFTREDSAVLDVPSSSRDSAEGFAESLNLKHFYTAITKNPDAERTFISDGETRKRKIEEKYIFNPELKKYIQGKKLILVDDSIVRGSTLEFLVEKILDFYEPSEIHIRIPSPPIIAPCYYAINLKHPNELLARRFFKDPIHPKNEELEGLAKHLKVNSIRYVNQEELIDALRVDVKDMCLACITGDFPTPKGKEIFAAQLQEKTPA